MNVYLDCIIVMEILPVLTPMEASPAHVTKDTMEMVNYAHLSVRLKLYMHINYFMLGVHIIIADQGATSYCMYVVLLY